MKKSSYILMPVLASVLALATLPINDASASRSFGGGGSTGGGSASAPPFTPGGGGSGGGGVRGGGGNDAFDADVFNYTVNCRGISFRGPVRFTPPSCEQYHQVKARISAALIERISGGPTSQVCEARVPDWEQRREISRLTGLVNAQEGIVKNLTLILSEKQAALRSAEAKVGPLRIELGRLTKEMNEKLSHPQRSINSVTEQLAIDRPIFKKNCTYPSNDSVTQEFCTKLARKIYDNERGLIFFEARIAEIKAEYAKPIADANAELEKALAEVVKARAEVETAQRNLNAAISELNKRRSDLQAYITNVTQPVCRPVFGGSTSICQSAYSALLLLEQFIKGYNSRHNVQCGSGGGGSFSGFD